MPSSRRRRTLWKSRRVVELRPELLKNELDQLERKREDSKLDVQGMEVEVKRGINRKTPAEEMEGLKQSLVAKKARAREVESELAARHTALFGKLTRSLCNRMGCRSI